MKCSKCGAHISEGSLYCEKCGEEVQIVPLYEVEAELNLKQSITSFFEEMGILNGESERSDVENEHGSNFTDPDYKKKRTDFAKPLLYLLIIGIIIVIVLFFTIYCVQHSEKYLMYKGAEYTANYEYAHAMQAYEKVLEMDTGHIQARVALADLYCVMGKLDEYEQQLLTALKSEGLSEEHLIGVYDRLIKLYINQQKGVLIKALLDQCDNQTVRKHFARYIVEPPISNLSEGEYQGVQILKFEAEEGVEIYYSFKKQHSMSHSEMTKYSLPLVLEEGVYEIIACAVQEHGISSDMITYCYTIQGSNLSTPAVYPVSGSYTLPQFIEIDGNVDHIYYTTDGSKPTKNSKLYEGPIPMPLGNSVFKFARIEQEEVSQVVEYRYLLELTDTITNVKAVNIVADYALRAGKIKDQSGRVDESGARLEFIYQCVMPIGEEGYFYIIYENFVDSDGVSIHNGNGYGVDIYSGRLYQLEEGMYYNYELVEIENES